MKIIIGISGASGSIFGVRLLEILREINDVETHLIVSKWGQQTLEYETELSISEVRDLADYSYSQSEMGAAISSGSFLTDGMIIAPCSMRTVAAIANGISENLIHRAADVIIKEKRKLVLLPREAPLSQIHLENLLKLSRIGVVILPPDPAFYNKPKSIQDIVNHVVLKSCDQFDIKIDIGERWDGDMGYKNRN
ncbi:MAG: phenolic acid decarboxylase [Rhodospirillaceae bacterium]|nr:phenolic acid decarboxylase [Rhodospirillaceae bacterium]|tara:strand:- start:39722 stop:40303 length:582 start_codon:yes stop_codon:yes gene_type:complete